MSKPEQETKIINTQISQARRDLIQIGRDYVKYLQFQIDSGNISVVIVNGIVILLVIFGTISTAKAVTNYSTEIYNQRIRNKPGHYNTKDLCNLKLLGLNLRIAREIDQLEKEWKDLEVEPRYPLETGIIPEEIDIDKLVEQVENVENTANNNTEKVNTLQQKTDEHQQDIQSVQDKANNNTEKVNTLQQKTDEHQQDIQSVQDKANNNTEKVNTLQQKIDDYPQRIQNVENTANSNAEEIKVLQGIADDHQERIDDHEQRIAKLEEEETNTSNPTPSQTTTKPQSNQVN